MTKINDRTLPRVTNISEDNKIRLVDSYSLVIFFFYHSYSQFCCFKDNILDICVITLYSGGLAVNIISL